MRVQELMHDAGIELNADQTIWALRYLAAITDPDTHSREKHKSRIYKEWRGAGRKFVFRWAEGVADGMQDRREVFRDYIFELLAEAIPPCTR